MDCGMKFLGAFFCALVLLATAMGQEMEIGKSRTARDKLVKGGMHKDALELYREKLLPVSDEKSATDLEIAVQNIGSLAAWELTDEVIEQAVAAHEANAWVLIAAARIYQQIPQQGRFVAGVFERDGGYGPRRGNILEGGASSVSAMIGTAYRDKVRSLQLLRKAVEVGKTDAEKARAWKEIANLLVTERQSWILQTLTPLDVLPEWDEPGPSGATEGAPWTGDAPVLHALPVSWEAAKSDGERVRFALAETARLNPAEADEIIMRRAMFSQAEFGEQTLARWGFQREPEARKGIFELDSLTEAETIARTSDGIRRFRLPAEHHYIALYRSVMERRADAGDALVRVFLNRLQYEKAVEILTETIRRFPDRAEDRKRLLKQITGNWVTGGVVGTVAEGTMPRIPITFRNARKITFTAYPVDMEKVIADTTAYLKSNPKEIDWRKMQIERIAGMLFEKNQAKYIGKAAGEWSMDLLPAERHRETRAVFELPIDRPGAWWVRAKAEDGNEFFTLARVIDGVLVRRQAGEETIQYWLADAAGGAPVSGADVTLFGYKTEYLDGGVRRTIGGRRIDVMTKELAAKTDADGKFIKNTRELDPSYEWLVVARKEGRAAVFSGFEGVYLNHRSDFSSRGTVTYGISDRPLYKPGDTVHLRFSVRDTGYGEIDDDAWAGAEGKLEIRNGRGEIVAEFENVRTDAAGDAAYDFVIPKDATLGKWNARYEVDGRHDAGVMFSVEEFRKPEYEVRIEAPEEPVRLGDKFSAVVRASYFHGAPVRHADVEVIVKRGTRAERPFPGWRWDWLYGRGAWWPGTEDSWHPGWREWGCLPPLPWERQRRHASEEIVMREKFPIGNDGTVEIGIDSAPAKEIHGDINHVYTIEARVVDASRREERASGSVIAARKPLEVTVWADCGYAEAGDTAEISVSALSAAGGPVKGAAGTLRLMRLGKSPDGKISETEIRSWQVETDTDGKFRQKIEVPPAGQYRFSALLASGGSEAVEGAMIFSVFGTEKETGDWRFGPLQILSDKLTHQPGDTLKLRILSDRQNANVWMFLRTNGGAADEVKRIVLNGKSSEVKTVLRRGDQPNFFVEGITVHGGKVHTAVRQILLPPENKAIDVALEPAKTKVKPGEKSALKVTLRDAEGKPVSGKITLTVYDKALEAITGGSNVPPIIPEFWNWKNQYYAGFSDSIPPDGFPLSKPRAETMAHLGLGISARNDLIMDGVAMGNARGDMRMKIPKSMAMESAVGEMAPAPAVAADRLAEEPEAPAQVPVRIRKEFADLVKWAGEIETGADGTAEIPIDYPENLTTWKARVWTLLPGTRVGEGTAEIITSKELQVRMQMPRFLIERDEAVFSAIVHNDHAVAKSVQVSLEIDGAGITAMDGGPQSREIPAGGEARIDWRVSAKSEDEVTVRMKVESGDDGDAVEKKIPVLVHGMARQDAWSRVIPPEEKSAEIVIDVPEKLRPEETKLTIRYSPSVATAIVDAIPYLASYPYGCTEQTLNRFVPTGVAGKMLREMGVNLESVRNKRVNFNPQELGNLAHRAERWKMWRENPVFNEAEISAMTAAGIERLARMQNRDGGWGWFSGYGESSYPHTTAVVVHGLQTAKEAGAEIPEAMLSRGVAWLVAHERKETAALQLHVERAALRKKGRKIPNDDRYEKSTCGAEDAFVRMVLGAAECDSEPMLAFLHRDRLQLPVYARCLLGLEHHRKEDEARRDEVIRQISQHLKRDAENQTAYLDLGNRDYWWFWYGSDIEAHAWFLKLLSAAKPHDADTRGLVKYLVNNRKGGSYWNSTRDTAYAIEAISGYIKASGESATEMDVRILLDGKEICSGKINRDNLFTYDSTVLLTADEVKPGRHVITLEKSGGGALYGNAYLEVFTLEDRFREAGLEVKVHRKFWKLSALDKETETVDAGGLVVKQQGERFKREPLADGDSLKSGDRVEVELILESKNDYEYLLFSDRKPAGCESLDALSGYIRSGGFSVYQEPRDKSVNFFIRSLPRGTHTIRHTLRAETPGIFKAMPAESSAMYAPELRGNSEDFSLRIE